MTYRGRWVWMAALLAMGCQMFGNGPERAASGFWDAVAVGDYAAARSWVTAESAEAIDGEWDGDEFGDVTLGEVVRDGDAATVETRLMTRGDQGFDVTFQTHLVREEGNWRVDLKSTSGDLVAAVLGDMTELFGEMGGAMGEAMGEVMGEAMEGLAEGLAKGLAEMSESLGELKPGAESRRN